MIAGDDDSEPSASNDFGTITGPNGVAIPGGPYDDPRGKTTCITGIDPSYANKTIRFFVTNGIVSLDEWSAFFAIGEGNITEEGSAEVALFDINFNNWKYRGVVTVLALIYDDTGYVAARWAETHAGGGYNTSGSEFLNFEGRRIELDWEDFDQDV
ncbi:MAG: hypothetical protein LBP60_05875 [Spirochaetaceae bacterium]|nr:hypothetical protein [Spirochaetaceae bacterium]